MALNDYNANWYEQLLQQQAALAAQQLVPSRYYLSPEQQTQLAEQNRTALQAQSYAHINGPSGQWNTEKEKPMTRYYDKHGTEIREGDRYDFAGREKVFCCAELEAIGVRGMDNFNHIYATVLSRADGTPVYRYKGGEDVRAGDEYDNPDMGRLFVRCHAVSDGANTKWADCTLIRRAGETAEKRPYVFCQGEPVRIIRGMSKDLTGIVVRDINDDLPTVAVKLDAENFFPRRYAPEDLCRISADERRCDAAATVGEFCRAIAQPTKRTVEDVPEGVDTWPDAKELAALTGSEVVPVHNSTPWSSSPYDGSWSCVLKRGADFRVMNVTRLEVFAEPADHGLPKRKKMAQQLRSVVIRRSKELWSGRAILRGGK